MRHIQTKEEFAVRICQFAEMFIRQKNLSRLQLSKEDIEDITLNAIERLMAGMDRTYEVDDWKGWVGLVCNRAIYVHVKANIKKSLINEIDHEDREPADNLSMEAMNEVELRESLIAYFPDNPLIIEYVMQGDMHLDLITEDQRHNRRTRLRRLANSKAVRETFDK